METVDAVTPPEPNATRSIDGLTAWTVTLLHESSLAIGPPAPRLWKHVVRSANSICIVWSVGWCAAQS